MGNGMEDFEGRYIDNGMLDFLLEEREGGTYPQSRISLIMEILKFSTISSPVMMKSKWDFVQIQLNYVDWKHAKEINTRNTDAEYLYGELAKKEYPCYYYGAVIGRTSF